jgi:glycosyltransferase involved in cell wall biosynthesis
VTDGGNGYLVASDEEWVERLTTLLDDPPLRDRLGRNGRALVEERFALEKQAAILAKVLRQVAEGRERAR